MADQEPSGVALRYASALFDLAKERGDVDAVARDVATLRSMVDDSADLRLLLASPIVSAEDKVRGLSSVMDRAGIGALAANLVKLAAKNRRAFVVPAMLRAFGALVARDRGEKIAVVTSAEPLTDAQTAALKDALSAKVGGPVTLETNVDPSLIGGLIVRLGSQMIDTSVRTRLQGLRHAMKEAA